jgi:4-hydroxymandelate oxidase
VSVGRHTGEAHLADLATIDDFEAAARARLSRSAYDYFRSGADAEETLRDNRAAFARYAIWPRVLVDVSTPRLATRVLGLEVPHPIFVAPTAYHKLACDEGELATARAAHAEGALYVVSTLATTRIDEVAAAAPGPKWFQLYVHKDRGLARELVRRAEAAGYLAIVLTVDTPVLGRRVADERNRFALPPGLTMPNLLPEDGAFDPGDADDGVATLSQYIASRHDASLTFRDVEALVASTRLPVVLKGVLRADDAVRGLDAGARGVVVSNHGARQLDGAPATLDALPAIVEAVGARADVLFDGGVRWGSDVLKALGLGARAVLVGRPVLWGLGAAGERGAARVLAMLRDDLARAMALAGCDDVTRLPPDLVRPRRS